MFLVLLLVGCSDQGNQEDVSRCKLVLSKTETNSSEEIRFGGFKSLYHSSSLHLFFYTGFRTQKLKVIINDEKIFDEEITTKPQLSAAKYIEVEQLNEVKQFEVEIGSCQFDLSVSWFPTNIIGFDLKNDSLVLEFLEKPIPVL